MEYKVYKCKNCGGNLEFAPGTHSMECPYCGTMNEIESPEAQAPTTYEELDFEAAKADFSSQQETVEVQIIKCTGCGAEVTLEGSATTGDCDYCGTHLVATGQGTKVMKPQYLLPFDIPRDQGQQVFRQWVKKLWFAPNAVKKYNRVTDPLKGVYYPFWTYDSKTTTKYSGERGENYQVKVKDKNSQGETVTRTVTKTRWYPASGVTKRFFDDVLVPASRSLPGKLANRLDDWDLKKMVNYNEQYLSGFKAEAYSVGLEEGFQEAKEKMEPQIRRDVKQDIGGDSQKIHSLNTNYRETKFKYISLPVYNLTYKFKEKFYQVLINGQTGEVEGERPISFWKVFFTVAGVIALGVGGYFLYQWLSGNLGS